MTLNHLSATGTSRLRIVLLGYLVRCPIGGMAWHHLQYVKGLANLGHDVFFLEDSGDDPWACYDPSRGTTDPDPSYGLTFAASVFQKLNLTHRWAYYDALQNCWHGPAAEKREELCNTADLLLNLSGSNLLRDWTRRIPRRVFIDTDPVFTQLRHRTDPARKNMALAHTDFFSFGENIGQPACEVPDDGIPWQPTRQPIVLDEWPVLAGPCRGRFTTVMQWDNTLQNVPRSHSGRLYGKKGESFEQFYDLPSKVPSDLELAVGGQSTPRERLRKNGWFLCNPLEVTRDPWSYQRYIQQSKGEFSVAKHGYVTTNSGWFSERSAAYLASGRPVITQDTGFSEWLDADGGVFAFKNPGEAVAAIEEIDNRYEYHCNAARRAAENHFDSNAILSALLTRIGVSRASGAEVIGK